MLVPYLVESVIADDEPFKLSAVGRADRGRGIAQRLEHLAGGGGDVHRRP